MSLTRNCQGEDGYLIFESVWKSGECENFMGDLSFINAGSYAYDKNNVKTARDELMPKIFNYFSTAIGFHSPTDPRYNPIQGYILEACKKYPMMCSDFLGTTLCKGVLESKIASSPWLGDWCGCYYTNPLHLQTRPETIYCDQFCLNAIPSYNVDTGEIYKCNSTVCIISDVSIQLASSTLGGKPLFTQMCNCSPEKPCYCIFKNITIEDFLHPGEAKAIFNSSCNKKDVYVGSSGPGGGNVNFKVNDTYFTKEGIQQDYTWTYVTFGVLGFFLVVGIVVFFVRRNRLKHH